MACHLQLANGRNIEMILVVLFHQFCTSQEVCQKWERLEKEVVMGKKW